MGTLADLLIPLAGSISNERAIKMREACDSLEAKIDIAQRGMNHAHDLISLLTDRVKDLESDNLDSRLTKLESAVDVLDRQRVETLKLRVNGLEDRVSMLEAATKHTGEGSTSQTGAVSHSQSGGGSDGTREPARSACIDDAGTTQDTPSPGLTVKPCPCGAPARIRQADNDWMISCTDIACDWCIGGGLYASKEDMLRAWNRRAPAETLRAVRLNTGEGASTREGDVGELASDADPKPSPASSVPAIATGEVHMQAYDSIGEDGELICVNVWPDLSEQMSTHGFATFYGPTARVEAARYLAIRAPAAPVVDVNALLTRFYSELDVCDLESKAMTRALAAQGVKCKEVQP